MSVSTDFKTINNELREIRAELNGNADLKKIEEKVKNLCNPALKNFNIKSREGVLTLNDRIHKLVCLIEEKKGLTDSHANKLADNLADFAVGLAKLTPKLAAKEREESIKKTKQFKELLDGIFSGGFETEENATQLVELLKENPRFDFSIFSKKELESINERIAIAQRKNREQAHVGVPFQYAQVEEVLKLYKSILDVKDPESGASDPRANTIENAYKHADQREQGDLQKARLNQVINNDDAFGLAEFNALKNQRDEQLEIYKLAKQTNPELFEELQNRSNLQLNDNERLKESKASNKKVGYDTFLENILAAVRRKDGSANNAFIAPHYKLDFSSCNDESISRSRHQLNKIVDEVKYNDSLNARAQMLRQEFEAAAAAKPRTPRGQGS